MIIRPQQRIFYLTIVLLLTLPLVFIQCAKKKDPNSTYKSQKGSMNMDEADLNENGSGNPKIKGLKTVYFAFDSAQLTHSSRQTLKENAEILKINSKDYAKVLIEGHCDDRGSTEYNLALGERRAQAVMQYLNHSGVPKKILSTISYGEEHPAVLGNNEAAWAKNRRVDFTQSSKNYSMKDF